MTLGWLAVAIVIALPSQASAGSSDDGSASNTTVVRNGNSIAIITQSGDPDRADVYVEKQPGRTFIYRQSGDNTSIVTQSSDPADVSLEHLPPWIQDLLRQ